MKIVYAAPHFPPKYIGGTERVVERLANRFYAKGYSVDVIVVEEINRKGFGVTCQTEGVALRCREIVWCRDLIFYQGRFHGCFNMRASIS